jgi:hypothetical protein
MNYRNPNDPFYRNAPDDAPEDKNNRWGVIVGVLFLVIVAGLALGVGHKYRKNRQQLTVPSGRNAERGSRRFQF